MTRPSIKPTREPGSFDDYLETHPAYGVIGASRVSNSAGANLFGSDFRHGSYVVIRIAEGELGRGLSNDHVYSNSVPIAEVALSEAQWATFVSAMNIGHGTACTLLSMRDGDYTELPSIESVEDSAGRYGVEVNEKLQGAIDAVDEIIAAAPSKKLRETAERARKKLTDSLPWVLKQYREHGEDVVEKAKLEVNAYVTQTLHRAGLEAIGGTRPLELATDDDPDPLDPADTEDTALTWAEQQSIEGAGLYSPEEER